MQRQHPGESRHAYATVLTGTAAPSSEAVTDAYRSQQHSLRRSGVNNRAVAVAAAATGHCNGNSVPIQPQARLNATYEIYHIHRQPGNQPSQSQKTYSYLSATASGQLHNKDLSQGSCDNTPATPDSLDSLGGSDTSAVSSSLAIHEEASGHSGCTTTSTYDNNNILPADNNNTIKPGHQERNNLIEELTTLITATRPLPYRRDEQTPSPQVSSSSPASTPENQDKTMSSSSSSSSSGTNGGLSSSLTPSTVVIPPSSTTLTANVMSSPPLPRRYYFEGGGGGVGGSAAAGFGRGQQPAYTRHQPTSASMASASKEDVPVYEQLTSTMLRRSRSQQLQGKVGSSLSVGNTPPLPAKHVMNSHYMPLQAYATSGSGSGLLHQRPYHYQDTRRSNPQIHYATELVLTPHQAQQIQQSLVNRYATIGRNYHISVGCDQQTAIKADVHQRPTAGVPHTGAPPVSAKAPHSMQHPTPNPDTLAMRINNNLIKGQIMTMGHKEVPLADIRRLPEVATPTTVSMTSKRLSSSEDILSAESTTECCDEDGRLSPDHEEHEPGPRVTTLQSPMPPSRPAEEERVRKHTLLSTLVMPRPQRKPPFTIEAAMSKLLGRTKKKEKSTATAAASENASTASFKKTTETNGRGLKASLPSPNKPDSVQVTNGASDEAAAGSGSVLDVLRQAGSDSEQRQSQIDCASNVFGEDRGLLPSDEELATLPDYSDGSEVVKKRSTMQVLYYAIHLRSIRRAARDSPCRTVASRYSMYDGVDKMQMIASDVRMTPHAASASSPPLLSLRRTPRRPPPHTPHQPHKACMRERDSVWMCAWVCGAVCARRCGPSVEKEGRKACFLYRHVRALKWMMKREGES